jgi:hypothetical protein
VTVQGPETKRAIAANGARPSLPDEQAAPAAAPPHRAPWVGAEPPRAQVVLGAGVVLALAVMLEVAVRDHIGLFTGLVLVAVSIGAALLMRPDDLFTAGVLPPLLTLVLLVGVAVLHPAAVSVRALDPGASAVQVVIAGFVDVAGALVVAHMLALLLVGLRVRAARQRRSSGR